MTPLPWDQTKLSGPNHRTDSRVEGRGGAAAPRGVWRAWSTPAERPGGGPPQRAGRRPTPSTGRARRRAVRCGVCRETKWRRGGAHWSHPPLAPEGKGGLRRRCSPGTHRRHWRNKGAAKTICLRCAVLDGKHSAMVPPCPPTPGVKLRSSGVNHGTVPPHPVGLSLRLQGACNGNRQACAKEWTTRDHLPPPPGSAVQTILFPTDRGSNFRG